MTTYIKVIILPALAAFPLLVALAACGGDAGPTDVKREVTSGKDPQRIGNRLSHLQGAIVPH